MKFGGDDIDRMLEAGSNSYRGPSSYNAVPPPSYGRGRGDNSYRGRGSRGGGRGGDRDRGGPGGGNGRGNEEEYYSKYRRSSLSPPPQYMSREEEEMRRKDRQQQDVERDQRTVFACQIHPKCDERDIFAFFSQVGQVVDVQLIRDNRTFKSKGYAPCSGLSVSCTDQL